MRDHEPKTLSRKDIHLGRIGATALFSLSAVLSGCSAEPQPRTVIPSRPAAVSTIKPSAEIPRSVSLTPDQINQYTSAFYPELRGKNPNQSGTIITEKGTTILWINYTDASFDPDATQKIISFLEDDRFTMRNVPMTDGTKDFTFSVNKRPARNERAIFILPENTPRNSYVPELSQADSLTMYDPTTEARVSFVKHTNTPAIDQPDTLLIEACKQIFSIDSSIASLRSSVLEEVCVSLSIMLTYKQEGMSYSAYQNKVNTGGYTNKYKIFVMSEQVYNNAPKTGKVMRKN